MSELPPDFVAEVAAADAVKLRLLSMEVEGLRWENEARPMLEERLAKTWQRQTERVILFTGHRIDSADREAPRFPAEAEGRARAAIGDVVKQQATLANKQVVGISGGANGGDILFQEQCAALGIERQMLLALPVEQFIAASVKAESGDWVARFKKLEAEAPVTVLAQSKKLPAWLGAKPGYDIWQRNNFWLIAAALAHQPAQFMLVALWDGKGGDGPGGTQNMVDVAQRHGAHFILLNTEDLLTRNAAR